MPVPPRIKLPKVAPKAMYVLPRSGERWHTRQAQAGSLFITTCKLSVVRPERWTYVPRSREEMCPVCQNILDWWEENTRG